VLVVNDDRRALKLADTALKHSGWTPFLASDAVAGLEMMEKGHPQAVVLDLMMPEVDGFEFLERARRLASGKNIPVIVWTVKELTQEDYQRLHSRAEAVVVRNGSGIGPLLEELALQTGAGGVVEVANGQ